MHLGDSGSEDLSFVSNAERAARYSQKAIAIALRGSTSKNMAYKLERKLFDNGHVVTVLETSELNLITTVKNAGLLVLTLNSPAEFADVIFDTDTQTLDVIYTQLKAQNIIY